MDSRHIPFRVEVADGPEGPVVAPHGELDLATQQELRDVLAAHAGKGTLTLDLSSLRFLDTSGLRLILETAEGARRDGTRFVVVRGPEHVQRLFEIAGVADLVPFRDPEEGGAS